MDPVLGLILLVGGLLGLGSLIRARTDGDEDDDATEQAVEQIQEIGGQTRAIGDALSDEYLQQVSETLFGRER